MYTIDKNTLNMIKAFWKSGLCNDAHIEANKAGFIIQNGEGCDCPGGDNAIIIHAKSDESGRDIAMYWWLEPIDASPEAWEAYSREMWSKIMLTKGQFIAEYGYHEDGRERSWVQELHDWEKQTKDWEEALIKEGQSREWQHILPCWRQGCDLLDSITSDLDDRSQLTEDLYTSLTQIIGVEPMEEN